MERSNQLRIPISKRAIDLGIYKPEDIINQEDTKQEEE